MDIAYEAVFINGGQTCCAGTRTFVQDSIYDAFVKKAGARAAQRKVGDPFKEDTEQGPQVRQKIFCVGMEYQVNYQHPRLSLVQL